MIMAGSVKQFMGFYKRWGSQNRYKNRVFFMIFFDDFLTSIFEKTDKNDILAEHKTEGLFGLNGGVFRFLRR